MWLTNIFAGVWTACGVSMSDATRASSRSLWHRRGCGKCGGSTSASLTKARFALELLGLKNVTYEECNIEDSGRVAPYDLCLCLGLLYHLENPVLSLRKISSITGEVCIIETQVVDEVEGSVEWGARAWTRPYQGILALLDESGEFYNHNSETGASPIAACPSPKALEFMLQQAGFRRTEIVDPPADAYEQHRRAKRLVCIANK